MNDNQLSLEYMKIVLSNLLRTKEEHISNLDHDIEIVKKYIESLK